MVCLYTSAWHKFARIWSKMAVGDGGGKEARGGKEESGEGVGAGGFV
jgi:hypothetical protein